MRTFGLVDGNEVAFWNIEVSADTVTESSGRTDTEGQTTVSRFASAEQARAEAANMIEVKIGEGYREDPSGLGLTLYRVEEASLAWGRPLDTVEPAAGTFVPKQAEAMVRALGTKHEEYGADLVFPKPPFDGVPSPDEARWWLWWMRTYLADDGEPRYSRPSAAQRLKRARERYLTLPPPTPNGRWSETYWYLQIAAELTVFGVQEVLDRHTQGGVVRIGAVPALRALVLPRTDAAERSARLEGLAPARSSALDRAVGSALFADPEQHLEQVERAPDDLIVERQSPQNSHYHWEGLVAVLSGLPSREHAVRAAERFDHERHPHDYCVFSPRVVSGLLGVLGVEALPIVTKHLAEETNSTVAEARLAFLTTRVHGPAAVPAMVHLAHASKAPVRARTWLAAHPRALAQTATAFRGKDADVVAAAVRQIATEDPAALGVTVINPTVRTTLTALAAEAATPVVVAGAEPQWWVEAVAAEAALPAAKSPAALPGYAGAGALPSVVLEGSRLRPEMVEAVVRSAMRSAVGTGSVARPLVAAVRDRLPLADRDTIAVALLDGWLGAGAPSKEKAVFVAAGFFGADGFVARLVPLVRDWPGQSQHARAVLGLDVLVATGRLTALQGISGIAAKSKFKGIQEAARRAMARLAAAAGLSPDQLADRIVPDGGLDAHGTRVLSYGPRSFRVGLSPQGKLVVRALDDQGRPQGKPRTALPAPNSKDDPAAAAAAKSEFTVLRKQLTDLAKVQTTRLKQAMISGRTWTGAEHRTYLVANPLLNSLIRPLIWAINPRTPTVALARVTEDREYLTVDDDVIVPADDATITLAHPLYLTQAERTTWHDHLISYDLLPPIEQLDRATYTLPDGQRGRLLSAEALPHGKLHPGTLVGLLDRYGWHRGNPADAGIVNYAWRPFPAHDRAVVIEITNGLWTGMIADSGDQEITSARVTTPRTAEQLWYVDDRMEQFDWTDLDPLVISETLRSFAAMTEKAT